MRCVERIAPVHGIQCKTMQNIKASHVRCVERIAFQTESVHVKRKVMQKMETLKT